MSDLKPTKDKASASVPDHDVWFVVPAAGIGQRMGANIPKQYLPFLDSTIIETTLSVLLKFECVKGIVVAIHPEDTHWSSLPIANDPRIHTVVGGAERSQSVLAGLDFLRNKVSECQWVLVHDAARPCIHLETIRHLYNGTATHAVGGILAVRCSDTLKSVNANNDITATVDRRDMWQAQTPQMFRYQLLYSALSEGLKQQSVITDEASALEQAGYSVTIVEGRRDNIKITQSDDLVVAEAIYQRNSSQ
ncbi:2-C-methyl-D-erythritol 4-phosphate cytidylyltransferase [Eionea flava]